MLDYQYGNAQWLMRTKLVWRYSEGNAFPDDSAASVSIAYRISKLAPYPDWARVRSDEHFDLPQPDPTGLSASQAAAAAGINAITQRIRNNSLRQRSRSAGLRRDVMKKLDFKLRLDSVHKPSGSNGLSPTAAAVSPATRRTQPSTAPCWTTYSETGVQA